MKILHKIFRLFSPGAHTEIPSRPSGEDMIRQMYDRQLDTDRVQKVIYTPALTMRYVIFKNHHGLFSFILESICPRDEKSWEMAWKYDGQKNDILPGNWEEDARMTGTSFFDNMDDVLKYIKSTPEYHLYFTKASEKDPME